LYCKKIGFKVIHCPIPFTSFLPWPSCARRQIVIPPPVINTTDRTCNLLLIKTRKDMFNSLKKYQGGGGELWQEDWVKPYNWYSLEPAIYTFFSLREYLKNLINYKKKFKNLTFKYVSHQRSKNLLINFYFHKNIRPRILSYLLYYISSKLRGKLNKLFN
jgi:hypothetical protein